MFFFRVPLEEIKVELSFQLQVLTNFMPWGESMLKVLPALPWRVKDLDGDVILKIPQTLHIFKLAKVWNTICQVSLYKSPMFFLGIKQGRFYGKFEGFPYDSALFGLGNIMSTVFLPQFDLKKRYLGNFPLQISTIFSWIHLRTWDAVGNISPPKFPYNSALFGLGNIMTPVFLPQFDLKKGT